MSQQAITSGDLVRAAESVLITERKPLEIWRIAQGCCISEDEVIALLFQSMRDHGTVINFRYPPLPCAAVTGIHRRERSQ